MDPKHSGLHERVRRASRYLRKLPPAISGQRGHDATFRAACTLVRKFALPTEVALGLLFREYNPRCQPPWSGVELLHKVTDAILNHQDFIGGRCSPGNVTVEAWTSASMSKWPEQDDLLRKQLIGKGPNLGELISRSSFSFHERDHPILGALLDFLFGLRSGQNPLLCLAKTKSDARTNHLSNWLGDPALSTYSLIVPSPMCAVQGLTRDNRLSSRCLHNTGPRHYLVIEFDQGSFDEQAALLWHLGQIGCLVMVVHSGNKSLHGWFLCRGESEDNLKKFMDYAVRLGADHSLWTPCQLVRLPFGLRDNGTRQRVLYLNSVPILDRRVLNGC